MGDRRPTRAPTSHFRLRARSRRCPITPPYTNHPPLPHIPLYRSFLNLVISAALRADLTYSHIVRVRSHVFISTMLLRYLLTMRGVFTLQLWTWIPIAMMMKQILMHIQIDGSLVMHSRPHQSLMPYSCHHPARTICWMNVDLLQPHWI